MTTKEEFNAAIEAIIACTATVRCGCTTDPDTAEFLMRICKHYVDAYEERFK